LLVVPVAAKQIARSQVDHIVAPRCRTSVYMPPQKTERGELLTACPDPLDGDVRVLLDELDICLRLPGKVLLHNVSKLTFAFRTRY
jgi:hypothetical protein